jgi:Protein of unknown function (DUF3761)
MRAIFLALLATSILLVPAAPLSAQTAATVTCKDGTTANAGKGACSHHGGVNHSASQPGSTAAPGASRSTTPAPDKSQAPSATQSSEVPAQSAAPPAKSTRAPVSAPTTGSSKAGNTDPTGAIAQCKDGTYSHSKQHTGACSHHGGVSKWLDKG